MTRPDLLMDNHTETTEALPGFTPEQSQTLRSVYEQGRHAGAQEMMDQLTREQRGGGRLRGLGAPTIAPDAGGRRVSERDFAQLVPRTQQRPLLNFLGIPNAEDLTPEALENLPPQIRRQIEQRAEASANPYRQGLFTEFEAVADDPEAAFRLLENQLRGIEEGDLMFQGSEEQMAETARTAIATKNPGLALEVANRAKARILYQNLKIVALYIGPGQYADAINNVLESHHKEIYYNHQGVRIMANWMGKDYGAFWRLGGDKKKEKVLELKMALAREPHALNAQGQADSRTGGFDLLPEDVDDNTLQNALIDFDKLKDVETTNATQLHRLSTEDIIKVLDRPDHPLHGLFEEIKAGGRQDVRALIETFRTSPNVQREQLIANFYLHQRVLADPQDELVPRFADTLYDVNRSYSLAEKVYYNTTEAARLSGAIWKTDTVLPEELKRWNKPGGAVVLRPVVHFNPHHHEHHTHEETDPDEILHHPHHEEGTIRVDLTLAYNPEVLEKHLLEEYARRNANDQLQAAVKSGDLAKFESAQKQLADFEKNLLLAEGHIFEAKENETHLSEDKIKERSMERAHTAIANLAAAADREALRTLSSTQRAQVGIVWDKAWRDFYRKYYDLVDITASNPGYQKVRDPMTNPIGLSKTQNPNHFAPWMKHFADVAARPLSEVTGQTLEENINNWGNNHQFRSAFARKIKDGDALASVLNHFISEGNEMASDKLAALGKIKEKIHHLPEPEQFDFMQNFLDGLVVQRMLYMARDFDNFKNDDINGIDSLLKGSRAHNWITWTQMKESMGKATKIPPSYFTYVPPLNNPYVAWVYRNIEYYSKKGQGMKALIDLIMGVLKNGLSLK